MSIYFVIRPASLIVKVFESSFEKMSMRAGHWKNGSPFLVDLESFLITVLTLAVAVLGIVLWPVYRARRLRGFLQTLLLPHGSSAKTIEKYVKCYLHANGWKIEGPAPQFNLPFSAIKDGYMIFFYIPSKGGLSLQSQIRDADEAAYELQQPIAIINYELNENEVKYVSLTYKVFLIRLSELPNLLDIHHAHRVSSRRQFQ